MTAICERLLNYLKIKEIKAQEVDEDNQGDKKRLWPRMLSFVPGSRPCEEDDDGDMDHKEKPLEVQATVVLEIEEEEDEEECQEEGDNKRRAGPSALSRKLNCMYHSAKYGLKEGALSGIFFGGGWGIYKYLDAAYLNKEGKEQGEEEEGGESSGDNGSTINDNVIFVTAANSAIAMGVFCTFYCCTKAAIYCS